MRGAFLVVLTAVLGCQSPDPALFPEAQGRARAGYDARYDENAPPWSGGNPVQETCPECAGSGACSFCDGSGQRAGEACPPCAGSRRCLRCEGRGSVAKGAGPTALQPDH